MPGAGLQLTTSEVSRTSHTYERIVVRGLQRAKSEGRAMWACRPAPHFSPAPPSAFPRLIWLHLHFGFKRQCKVQVPALQKQKGGFAETKEGCPACHAVPTQGHRAILIPKKQVALQGISAERGKPCPERSQHKRRRL